MIYLNFTYNSLVSGYVHADQCYSLGTNYF